MSAYRAFLNPDMATGGSSFTAGRVSRYDRLWSLYQNTAYDNLTIYLASYPANHRLYAKTRGLRNPLGAYVDFWQANIWGGVLDIAAGDGDETPTALPIVTDNERLRPAIAQVWEWSNWGAKRQVVTLHGASLGDAILKVVDNPTTKKVYLQAAWPGTVADCEWDDNGNIKRIVFEYVTSENNVNYTYKEIIEHPSVHGQGSGVRFQTFKNNVPFAYPGNLYDGRGVAEWFAPYDFVPVVHIPFVDAGIGWGTVGFQQVVRLIDETSAKASVINDQLAKELNPPLKAQGVRAGDLVWATSDNSVPIVYLPKPPGESDLTPLVFDMSIDDAVVSLATDIEQIKELLPELQFSRDMRSGMSGAALRTAYSPLISKIQSVRANFDDRLVRAQNMAVAIGGIRGYGPEFAGFSLDSYGAGALKHQIGNRPVLPRGQDEELAELKMRAEIMGLLVNAGADVYSAALAAGFDEEQAAAFLMGEVVSGVTQ